MTDDRHDQIRNNVVEEFADRGDVTFATKRELCEVILKLLDEMDSLRRDGICETDKRPHAALEKLTFATS